jgi:hypothetical protein
VPEEDVHSDKTKTPSSSSSSCRPIFYFVDPPSDMKSTILQLDAISLAAMQKLDGIPVDERHVAQIQNQLLPRCLEGEQLLKLLDVLGCLDPAAEREQNLTISFSPSFQHSSTPCMRTVDVADDISIP